MNIKFKRIVNVGLLLVLTLVAIGLSSMWLARTGNVAVTADASAPPIRSGEVMTVVAPAPGAATACPPFSFIGATNLAKNPSFEIVGPKGSPTSWHSGDPIPPPSAARFWLMHTNDAGAIVASKLRPSTVSGPGGAQMLHFRAGGNEGGIVQQLSMTPAKLMFSAWVYVRRGRVAIQTHADSTMQGPVAWSTKRNEWEQLRVCTDGTVQTGFFSIYNQDTAGGDFFVDRVEIRETP